MTTQTKRTLTLLDVATLAGSTKRTAQRWLEKATAEHGELGELIEGTRLFSEAEKDTLLSYQSKRPQNTVTADEPEQPAPVAAELQIYEGNHQVTLPTPQLSSGFALDTLRADADVLSYDDPLTLAQSVLAQNQQIIGAMDVHRQQQVQKLAATSQALQAIQLSNQQLRDAAVEYKIDSRVQGAQLNQATQQLGMAVAEQQRLGKPVAPSSSESE
ncbi:MAG: hypothetical protein F6J97_08210 [Leptolyngbya sp. SIO4C1]|nr:hypothetical protein [Leptolyngbya sp. SIO4C1]